MPNRPETSISLSSAERDILLKYFPKGVCAFDLEMTGLSPVFDKIIEIAAMKMDGNGNLTTYHTLVNPLITVPEHTVKYHGLRNEHLCDAPSLKKPLKEYLGFIDNAPLLAHNAIFDASFLFVGMNENQIPPGLSSVFDSCKLSRHMFKQLPDSNISPTDNRLASLAEFFKLDFDHHRALDDAAVCLKIMANLLLKLDKAQLSDKFKEWSYLFKLNSFLKPAEYILPKKLSELKELVQTQTVFEMRYRGGSVKDEFRPVKPLSLLAMPRGLVLYAECKKTNINKYFKVKKIQKIRLKEA